jgi:hypothetical protein
VNKVQLLVDEVTIADNYEARRFHTALLGGFYANNTAMQLIARQWDSGDRLVSMPPGHYGLADVAVYRDLIGWALFF